MKFLEIAVQRHPRLSTSIELSSIMSIRQRVPDCRASVIKSPTVVYEPSRQWGTMRRFRLADCIDEDRKRGEAFSLYKIMRNTQQKLTLLWTVTHADDKSVDDRSATGTLADLNGRKPRGHDPPLSTTSQRRRSRSIWRYKSRTTSVGRRPSPLVTTHMQGDGFTPHEYSSSS